MKGVPQHIISASGSEWIILGLDKDGKKSIEYQLKGTKVSVAVTPGEVEIDWTRKGRPEPKSAITVQGKYECAAASLAMLLGEKLFTVKRAMGKFGWSNDDRGASSLVMIEAARYLGRDLLEIGKYQIEPDMGPASLTLPSLNVEGMSHALTWNGTEILDPNWGREGRIFWGCEWNPKTLGATHALILLSKNLTDEQRVRQNKAHRKNRSLADIRKFSEQIMKELEAA